MDMKGPEQELKSEIHSEMMDEIQRNLMKEIQSLDLENLRSALNHKILDKT
jgi:hypothetical protein